MNDDTADVDRLFARLSAEGPHRVSDDHPAPEKLSAYQANELSPEEDNEIQEHLAQCTLCTELLLDLHRFLDPPAEDLPREGVADFETVAGWRELRGRMGGRESAVASVSSAGRLGSLRVWQSLAAVLMVGVLALGGLMILREERGTPSPNPILIELEADGATRSSGEVVPLGGIEGTIDLALSLKLEALDYSSFTAEIEGNLSHFIVKDLQPRQGKVILNLYSPKVGLGLVKVTLWGTRNGKKKQVGTYTMTILR